MTVCRNFLEVDLGKEDLEIRSWEGLFEEKLGRQPTPREVMGGFGRGVNYFSLLGEYSDFSKLYAICTGFLIGHPHFGLPLSQCKTVNVFLSPRKEKHGGYGISFSVAGSNFGNEIKRMGIDDILLLGKAKRPVAILLDGTGNGIEMKLVDVDPGMPLSDILITLVRKYGYEHVAAVGPAAFRGVKLASVHFFTPMDGREFGLRRAAARGGSGLVLGAKNVKAIAIKGCDEKFPKPRNLNEKTREVIKQINRELAGEATKKYRIEGTWGGNFDFLLPNNALPAYNHSKLLGEDDQEVQKLWKRKLEEENLIKVENGHCAPCAINCVKKIKCIGEVSERIDYESLALLGCGTGVFDITIVSLAKHMADEYGIDAVSAGSVIAWYFEHNQRKGKEPTFGDGQALLDLIRKIAFREEIGDILAEGVKYASEKLGDKDIAMQVKGLEPPGYPAWSNPGYAFAVRGMCHTSMETYTAAVGKPDKVHDIEWWVDTLKKGARDAMLVQTGGLCHFSRRAILPKLAELLWIYAGVKASQEEIEDVGLQTYILARNIDSSGAGFDQSDDSLPERAFRFGTTKEWFKRLKDRFYEEMGFDSQGRVTKETLERYGLAELDIERKE